MRRFTGDRLVVATHNAGKMTEFRAMFAPLGVQLVSGEELGLPEPAETENTFLGNARIKAHAAAQSAGTASLGDDSGLEVDALDGAPGVFTANWAEYEGRRDFARAMERVHAELRSRSAVEPWRARFRCVLVVAWPDKHEEVFEGSVEGQLVWPLRGASGHGYDPMFLPDGTSKTFAQMSEAEKNATSHRARAFEAMIRQCFT